MTTKYLIVLYTVTAGRHYEELGSDEQEIVLFAWLVLDIINQKITIESDDYVQLVEEDGRVLCDQCFEGGYITIKIIDVKCNYVKPKYCEKLSEIAKNDFQLTEQLIEENGQFLENILEEFNHYVRNKLNYDNGEQFTFVTDGQQHFRQVLLPECTSKNINLPEYFYRFIDMKKEFRKFLRDNMTDTSSSSNLSNELLERSSTSSLDYQLNDTFSFSNTQPLLSSTSSCEFDQMIGDTPKMNSIFPSLLAPTIIQKFTIDQMLKELSLEPDSSAEVVVQAIKNMANIILNLISNGHVFDEEETISQRFEPGICSRNEIVDSMTVVRARGLPWQSSDQDVARFFTGLNIHKGGVALCLSTQGRRNGEALIRFTCVEHRELALKRHKHHIGQRYIEVYRAKGDDFIQIAGGNNNEAQQFLQKGGQVIIRMRGLPYLTTAEQVVDFFASHHTLPESTKSVESQTGSQVNNHKTGASNVSQNEKAGVQQKLTCTNECGMKNEKQDKNDLNNNIEMSDGEKSTKNATNYRTAYCQVMHGVEGVLFVRRKDNRASGDAFCLFENERQGQLALSLHKKLIGTRYIELFRSSTAEVQQVFNRTIDNLTTKGFEQNQLANITKQTFETNKAASIPATSFLPIHQPHNSIYQSANHTGIVNQATASQQAVQTMLSNSQSNLSAPTLQQATVLHQPTLIGHHLHHPNSLNNLSTLNYSGHSSFHQPITHHQLSSHAQHNLTSHATVSSPAGNMVNHYSNHCFNGVKSNASLNSNLSTARTLTKPHSMCTSPSNTSPLNDSNDHHQLIVCNKTNSRPLLCIQSTQPTIHPAQLSTSTNSVRKDCVRLRGLHYQANYEDILSFLGEFANQIVYQGIHMIYNMTGQATGEAFVQMKSEYFAGQAALAKHHKYMIFGKKQRYIEVFQCSLDDMMNGHFNITGNNLFAAQHALNTNSMMPATHYYHLQQNHLLASSRGTQYFHPVLYQYFYPSPPISPIYGTQSTMPIY